jgi:DNA-binding transcriptional LysR family regulator
VLQHLRYAVSAAEHGSFRRAAEALSLRQSTLSSCVRQVEELIGLSCSIDSVAAFGRPWPARSFCDARSILEQVDALAATAHKTGRGEAGRLAIGFYTSLSAGNLRATLTDVAQRFIELVERSRERLATGPRYGVVDIAIVPGAAPVQDSMVLSLWSQRLFAAIPDGHPLVERQAVYWIRQGSVDLIKHAVGERMDLDGVDIACPRRLNPRVAIGLIDARLCSNQ